MVSPTGTTTTDASGNSYRVVLSDDFSNGYQTANWGYAFGGGTYWNGAFSWSSADVAVRSGEMQVTDTRHADGSWTAGGFNSFKAGVTITYGTVEFDARVEAAQGTQAAILMWPASDVWPQDGEIDILEAPTNLAMHSTHWAGSDGSHMWDSVFSSFDPSQTHHYKMTWLPTSVTIQIDGQVVAYWTDPAQVPDTAMGFGAMGYVAAPGEAWLGGGPTAATPSTVTTHIDNLVMSQWTGGTGAPPVIPPAPPAPITTTLGSGSDRLVLKLSQDAWQGDATYTISVDGTQIGGVQTASAWHSAGQEDTVTVLGSWGTGSHQVTVTFTNDAYGGTADTDRNLHVEGISFNGTALTGATADLMSAGPVDFAFTKAAAVLPAPSLGTATPPASFGGRDAEVWKGQAHFGDSIYTTFGGNPNWGSGPNVSLSASKWDASWSTRLAFDNFVQATLDLSKAGSTDLMLISEQRGTVTLGAGNDHVTWVAHSSAAGSGNTMVIRTGAGDDVVTVTAAGLTPLADYDRTGNGSLYDGSYDGRYSIANVTFGSGNDKVTVESKAQLVLHAGSGTATAIGGDGNDYFYASTGTADFTGGLGRDTFVIAAGSGHVVIEDFATGADRLRFTGGLTAAGINTKAATEGGVAGLLVTYDAAGDSVFLAHVTKLAAGDMAFA